MTKGNAKRKATRQEKRSVRRLDFIKRDFRRENVKTIFEASKKHTKETSLNELSEKWLLDIRISVKESTFARYHRAIGKYILPKIGDFRLSKLKTQDINEFAIELLNSGGTKGGSLSPKTVTDVLTVLKSVLKFGAENGYMKEITGIRYPSRESAKMKVLTEDNFRRLVQILMVGDDIFTLGVLIALFTGMRIGELCGLRWGDIDWESRTIVISRTVERIPNLDEGAETKTKVIICEPKTQSSKRIIPIPKFLFERIMYFYKKLRRSERSREIFILSGTYTPIETHNVYVRYKKLMKLNGIGDYTFHALRHTFATRCVEAGFDTKSLSEILGHSNIATTLSVYVHPTLAQKRAQMDKLNPF